MKPKKTKYLITIVVTTTEKTAPDINTLCGDTIFLRMREGDSASWKMTKVRKPKRKG